MSKHTPGPWKAIGRNGKVVISGPGPECKTIAHAIEKHNAIFIAAAPDLLEACQFAAMALAAASERDPSFQRDYEKVSEAIAKARGG